MFLTCSNALPAENIANELANTVEDSSDLPDWEGKKLDLRMWYGSGTSSLKRNNKPTEDVVIPEIFRVTGVKFSEDSFDNGGELMDAKIGKIIAGNDWPDIVMNPERAVLDKMIAGDMVYDLTELIPKYCPNLMAMNEKNKDRIFRENNIDSINKDNPYVPIQLSRNIEYIELPSGTSLPIGTVFANSDIRDKAKYVVQRIKSTNGLGIVKEKGRVRAVTVA